MIHCLLAEYPFFSHLFYDILNRHFLTYDFDFLINADFFLYSAYIAFYFVKKDSLFSLSLI